MSGGAGEGIPKTRQAKPNAKASTIPIIDFMAAYPSLRRLPRAAGCSRFNEANSHREPQARSNQTRGRWRWTIEEPVSSTND